jgi:CHAT domain
MDVPRTRLQPGTTFEVSIFASLSKPRPGETSTDIVAESGAILEVRLIVSGHFEVISPTATRMTITEAERVDAEQRFKVRVRPKRELPVDLVPSLIALFFHNDRPCGSVRRTVDIDGVASQTTVPPPERADAGALQNPGPPPGRIQTDSGAPADLTVVVTSAVINDGRQFFCTVRSPSLDKYRNGLTEPWNLPQAAEDIVRSYMERFTADAITPSMLLAELRGAGRQLFDAAPKVFRQAFWDLIDAGVRLRTIAVVTEEPFIPWELMIPYRIKDGRRQQRDALGTEFLVGRWPSPDSVSPLPHIDLVDSFVIAPVYSPPLSFAQAEAAMVADSFQGEIITPAEFDRITQELSRVGKTLIHFVCHGEDEDTLAEVIRDPDRRIRDRVQIIRLEKDQTLNSTQILGIDRLQEIFEQRHPLVFINACEIGRTTPALVGVGGFAKSFIDIGASAVIAPLWAVKDRFAHEVAKTFYERLTSAKETPFAEIIRDLRRRAYEPGHAEDTFAAYCFYGDPAASQYPLMVIRD